MKKSKLKKRLITLSLIGTLIGINTIPVFAGTNRNFWDMTIYSINGANHLQNRAKETNNQYSWVKVTQRSSNLSSIDFKISASTFDISKWKSISSQNTWVKLDYDIYSNVPVGLEVKLSAMNSNWSVKSGSIAGVVDYE